MDELERYYIQKYDSFKHGYNATEGGDSGGPNQACTGERNGRALLTENDVIFIRECYNAHIPFREVYKKFQTKISKRGLQKVWWFDTWKNIHPEYETPENKYYHSHQAKANPSEVAKKNERAFTKEQILEMRMRYKNGETPKQIWLSMAPDRVWSTVYNAITKKTYQDIN